jgi:integrase
LFASENGYRVIRTRKKVKNKIVVIREHTARLAYQSLYERIKGIGKRAGIPQIFPHMLRHTFGTYLHAVEHDLVNVMYAMGHSRPETTARYARVLDDASRRQAEGLYSFVR